MKRIFFSYVIWILLLSVISLVVLSPIFRPGFLVTDDGNWMIIRLSAFYQSLRDGQFPVRFLGRLNFSYGYPVSNFLYPGFMYIGSILHLAGLSFQSSVEVIIIGSVIVGAVALFLWLKTFFSPLSSFFGAVSFVLNPYVLYDIYTRGSVGELLAIGTFFCVLLALEREWYVSYIPALAFLLISHNTAALFCFFVIIVTIYVRKKYSFIKPTFLAIGCSLFFWIPAIIEKRFVLFDTVSVSNPLHYFPVTLDLLLKSFPILLASLCLLCIKGKKYSTERSFYILTIIISTFFLSQWSSVFWRGNVLGLFVQFPYRILLFWVFVGSWILAYTADTYKKIGTIVVIFSLVWFGYQAVPYFQSESIVYPDGYYSTNEGTTTVANEYMPRWISLLPTSRNDKRVEVIKGNATIEPIRIDTNTIQVTIDASENSIIQINTIFYPGWGAMVDENPVMISYDNPSGVMQIPVTSGKHSMYVSFRETKSRFFADMISLSCILLYIGVYVIPFIFKRRKKN